MLAQESLASHWLELMPQKALDIVRGQRLAPGGDLVKLDFEYGRPSSKEFSTFKITDLKCMYV